MSKIFAEELPIDSVDLFITERCNLACKYCFHSQTDSDLTEERGKKILERLKEASPDHMTITFFGGEPMLNYDLILKLTEYAKTLWVKDSKTEKCAFRISTNGTIYNEEFFRKFVTIGGQIQISLDGDKETTESGRLGIDFNQVVENCLNIIKIDPRTNCRMTFTPETVGRLAQNIEFLHTMGFNNVMHHAVMEAPWTEELVKLYEYQLRQVYNYRRSVLRSGRKIAIYFIERDLRMLNGEEKLETDYCGAGKNYIAILPNGDVHSCHRAASARMFRLGNILSDSMPIIRGTFLDLDKKKTGCSVRCAASGTCHTCTFMHHIVNKNMMVPISAYCGICRVEDKMAREYLQTELNDRLERKINVVADILASFESDLRATKECISGLLSLVVDNENCKAKAEDKNV